MKSRFDQVLSEYSNLTINVDDLRKKMAQKLSTLDPKTKEALNAVTGAVEDTTETTQSDISDILNKLKDEKTSPEDRLKIKQELMLRGIIPADENASKDNEEEQQTKQSTAPTAPTNPAVNSNTEKQNSTTYYPKSL